MRHHWMILVSMILTIVPAAGPILAKEANQPAVLFDFGPGFDVATVLASDAKAAVTPAGTLRIELGHQAPWPGVTLKAPQGKWDLSALRVHLARRRPIAATSG